MNDSGSSCWLSCSGYDWKASGLSLTLFNIGNLCYVWLLLFVYLFTFLFIYQINRGVGLFIGGFNGGSCLRFDKASCIIVM